MKRAICSASILWAIGVAGCGKSNSPEQNASAQAAADAYCDCSSRAMELSFDELLEANCDDEEDAYKAAWQALPVGGQDPKADAIFQYQHACYTMFHDAKAMARQRANK